MSPVDPQFHTQKTQIQWSCLMAWQRTPLKRVNTDRPQYNRADINNMVADLKNIDKRAKILDQDNQ